MSARERLAWLALATVLAVATVIVVLGMGHDTLTVAERVSADVIRIGVVLIAIGLVVRRRRGRSTPSA